MEFPLRAADPTERQPTDQDCLPILFDVNRRTFVPKKTGSCKVLSSGLELYCKRNCGGSKDILSGKTTIAVRRRKPQLAKKNRAYRENIGSI
jgi:hypothetical protein